MRDVVGAIEGEYRRYKALGESTLAQLDDHAVCRVPAPDSNSVAVVLWHVAGNLESRFTDFLTSDGEKPWRDRDDEFEERIVSRAEAVAKWDRGWAVVLDALRPLSDEDLLRRVTVRGQSLSVAEALARSLAHTAYHVGQIVFLGKMWQGTGWTCLSIPRGASRAYNARPGNEKPAAHATTLQERGAHSIQPPPTTTSSS
jgi:hypothetical protein